MEIVYGLIYLGCVVILFGCFVIAEKPVNRRALKQKKAAMPATKADLAAVANLIPASAKAVKPAKTVKPALTLCFRTYTWGRNCFPMRVWTAA